MVDLETLGTRAGCKIISIGAVEFCPVAGVSATRQFSSRINRYTQPPCLWEDPDTVAWWGRQSAEARARLFGTDGPVPHMHDVLREFAEWLGRDVLVWGNGADFDNPILSAAYAALGWRQPWGNWNGRCYRTLKDLRPGIKLVRTGVHHDALDDAISQAEHAVRILRGIA
jgi:hypothetical protein